MKKNFWNSLWPTVFAVLLMFGTVAIARLLERPFSGIAAGLGLLLSYGMLFLQKHMRGKNADNEDEFEGEDDYADFDFDFDLPMLLMGYPNDRLYAVYDVGSQYYLYYLGNGSFRIKFENIPDSTPTYSMMMDRKKSVIIDKSSITEFSLEMKKCISTNLPSCAALHITTNGSKKKFIVIHDAEVEVDERTILNFFADVSMRRVPLSESRIRRSERRENKKEANAQFGRDVSERRDNSKLNTYKTIGVVLTVISAIVAVGTLFVAQPYELWIGLCYLVFAVSIVLCIVKSDYYSLVYTKEECKNRYGVQLYSILPPILISMGALELRTLIDITFISIAKLVIYDIITAVAITVILCLGNREVRRKTTNIIIVFALFAMFSFGLPGEINYVLDNYEPDRTVRCEISDMHINKSSKGPDEYYITVDREGEDFDVSVMPEEYERLGVGDKVTIGYYDGAIGLEYALLWSVD